MAKVFIDGSSGTAGLRIHSRLAERADIELTVLDGAEHRDGTKRARRDGTRRRAARPSTAATSPSSACQTRPAARPWP